MFSLLKQTRASGRSDGTGAVRGFISAARFWYALAVKHGYRSDNPARLLTMPARRRQVRRALTEEELRDLYRVVGGTGNDPVLDLLLLDFHRETAARMGGALTLRVCDVNPCPRLGPYGRSTATNAKFLSPALIDQCLTHAKQRAVASNSDTLFRYRSGAPLTRRRYNSIFKRSPDRARLGRSPGCQRALASPHDLDRCVERRDPVSRRRMPGTAIEL